MAKIYPENEDAYPDDLAGVSKDSLANYVLSKTQEWGDHIEANYLPRWEEYARIWRGVWANEDKTRETERSRIVAPATQQAVEDAVADIEEAVFAGGKPFDIRDNVGDQDPSDIAFLKKQLEQEFKQNKVRKETCDVLINAAVFGTGIAELVVEEVSKKTPDSQEMLGGELMANGVSEELSVAVKMRSVQPRNFRIDPTARNIEEAHGVAIDEFVPYHTVHELQESGIYKDVPVGSAPTDMNIEQDPELDNLSYDNKVRLLKYYGKVPRHLLEQYQNEKELGQDEEIVDLGVEETETDDTKSYYVEAIVVIANDGECILKAEENPFMMGDRPVVAFPWDITPGLFWGRGICEKAFNSQKAIDAELRARIDALAYTTHPMLAMDATRIPRGHVPTVIPGKNVLTNGNPSEVLMPFKFGAVDQITFAQADALQNMLRQATGTLDGASLSGVGSNNKTGAVSMVLGAMIKRQKRTLIHFQENFWLPFVEKAAWRYMQFNPDVFTAKDFSFVAESSLGMMAREYEVAQLTQLLQTMGQESPMYPALVMAIVQNMNLTNRDELMQILQQAAQPNPQQEQMAMEAHQKQMALQDAQVQAVGAQAQESAARAGKYAQETKLLPMEVEIKKMGAVTKNIHSGDGDDAEFEKRLKLADMKLKEKDLNIKEKDINLKYLNAEEERKASKELNSIIGN